MALIIVMYISFLYGTIYRIRRHLWVEFIPPIIGLIALSIHTFSSCNNSVLILIFTVSALLNITLTYYFKSEEKEQSDADWNYREFK